MVDNISWSSRQKDFPKHENASELLLWNPNFKIINYSFLFSFISLLSFFLAVEGIRILGFEPKSYIVLSSSRTWTAFFFISCGGTSFNGLQTLLKLHFTAMQRFLSISRVTEKRLEQLSTLRLQGFMRRLKLQPLLLFIWKIVDLFQNSSEESWVRVVYIPDNSVSFSFAMEKGKRKAGNR